MALKTTSAAALAALLFTLSGCFAADLGSDELSAPAAAGRADIGRAIEMAMSLVGAAPGEIVDLDRDGAVFRATYETDDDHRLRIAGVVDEDGPHVTEVCRWTERTCVALDPSFIWDEGSIPSGV